jgi:hypothetical protein
MVFYNYYYYPYSVEVRVVLNLVKHDIMQIKPVLFDFEIKHLWFDVSCHKCHGAIGYFPNKLDLKSLYDKIISIQIDK